MISIRGLVSTDGMLTKAAGRIQMQPAQDNNIAQNVQRLKSWLASGPRPAVPKHRITRFQERQADEQLCA